MEIGFFFKKFVTFFVEPLGLVLTFFALGLLFLLRDKKRYATVFLTLSFSLLFLFSYEPFSNLLVKNLEQKYPKYSYEEQVKYIHVLGSGHNTDTTQPLSSNLSNSGVKRVLEGVILHKNIAGSKIIFTGYEGKTKSANATMNAKLAMSLGVDEANIIIGEAPKDTMEEALFAKEIVADAPFALVTSATHMPRAMELFGSLGLNPVAAPTAFYAKEFDGYLKAPDSGSFDNSHMAIHEYIGILWSRFNQK